MKKSLLVKHFLTSILLLCVFSSFSVVVSAQVTNTTHPANSPYPTIQAAIDDAITVAGDVITVSSGTYTENVVVNKQLTIEGAGLASTQVNGNITISASGASASNRLIVKSLAVTNSAANGDGLTINAGVSFITIESVSSSSNGGDGVEMVAGALTTDILLKDMVINDNTFNGIRMGGIQNLVGLALEDGEMKRNDVIGFAFNPSGNATSVLDDLTITGTVFEHNGDASFGQPVSPAPGLGFGDVSLFAFQGDASLKDVTITGLPSSGAHIGLQFRGRNTPAPSGTITMDNVTITGSYLRPANHTSDPGGPGYGIIIQNYSDVSNISFTDVSSNTTDGHALFVAGLTTTLDIGNTSLTAQNANSGHIVIGTSTQNPVLSNVNATGATFNGVLASTATTAQHFAIEDKIVHAIDIPGLGFALVKTGNTYVTINSFIAPFTTAPDIQRAIDAASDGFTVNIGPGSYINVSASVNKSLTFKGNNSGISGLSPRNPESFIDNSGFLSNTAFTIDPSKTVSVDGIQFAGRRFISFNSADVITVSNSVCNWLSNGPTQQHIDANGSTFTSLSFLNNDVTVNGPTQQAFQLFGTALTGANNTILIKGNHFYGGIPAAGDGSRPVILNLDYIQGEISQNDFDQVDIGVLVATGCGDLTIKENDFHGLVRSASDHAGNSYAAGVVFFNPPLYSAPINIINNFFRLSDIGVRTCCGAPDFTGQTININNNSFTGLAYYSIRNLGTGDPFSATCNWYGSSDAGVVASQIVGPVTYIPYLTNGTDNSPSQGFQPVPGSCNGPTGLYVDDASNTDDIYTPSATGNDANPGTPAAPFRTIQHAIDVAPDGSTIYVDAGTYVEIGQIVIDKNLSIIGAGRIVTIIQTNQNTGNTGDSRGWFLVNDGLTFNLSLVTLDGVGFKIWQGIRHKGQGLIDNCIIKNILYEVGGPAYMGTGVSAFGGPTPMNVNVNNCAFSAIGRVGVLYFGPGITNSLYSGNIYVGKGSGDWLDYGVEVGAGAVVAIQNSNITDCRGVASVDASTSAGILVTTFFGGGTTATIANNIISNNTDGIDVGFDGSDASTVVAHNNDLSGNTTFAIISTAPPVDAECNWYGTNDGAVIATKISGPVDYMPWLSSGTDNSPATGFQPVPGSCNGETPANDLCPGAISIACGQTLTGNTGTGATIDAAVPNCPGSLPMNTAPGVWYIFLGDGLTTTLSLCGSGYDTKLAVYSGSCASLTCVAGNDDFCGLQSQVTFPTNIGINYFVLVTGSQTASGPFSLARTCGPSECPSPVITNVNTSTSVASATVHSLTGVPAGALLVLTTTNNTNAAPYNAIVTSSPSLTWTKRVDAGAASSNNAEIWTAVFAAGGNITVTSNWGVAGQVSVLYTVTGAEAVLGGASNIGTSQTAPSVAVTTTRANSILFSCTSDWNGINGATRTLRDGATDRFYFRDASKGYTAYYYTKATTSAGTYTEGVSSPTGQKASTAVLEIRCPGTPDVTAPTIISVSPLNGATGVATNTTVTATFSEAMNPATINGTTFELRNPSSVLVAATVSYNGGTNTATLTPSAALANSTTYTAKVIGGAPGVKDAAGNPMAGDYTWSFTTAAAPPACQPTVVSLDTKTSVASATVHSLTGVPAGALLVLTTTNNTNAAPYNCIVTSSPSLTWTKRVDAGAASSNNAEIWTAAFAAGGNITVTSNWGAVGQVSVLYTVTGAEAVLGGASGIGTSQSAPLVTVTTTRANSILFSCTSDWNGINGATRTLRDGATDRFYFRDAAKGYTAYYYTKATTSAGPYTEGVSSPTGQKASTAVLEIRCPGAPARLADPVTALTEKRIYNLGQNYPNPVTSETTIQFTLPKAEKVNLSLYDINGRIVKVLVNGSRDAGTHTVSFNTGSLAGGVYYYRMRAGDFINAKKLTIQR